MANYSQKSVNKSKNQNGKKPLDKKLIAIIAAVVAVLVIIGAVVGVTLGKKNVSKPSADETGTAVTQSVDSTDKETQAEAEAQSENETAAPTEQATNKTEDNNAKYPQKLNKIMYVTASTLNVRSAPSVDSKVIARFAEGNEAKVVGRHDKDWYIVDINGTKGYCSADYLSDKKGGVTEVKNPAPYMLYVNRKQNIVTVYKKDAQGNYTVPIKAMICSVGNEQGETPVGTFNTTDRYTWRLLVGGVYGQYATRITGHILFHSVPYDAQNKGALNPAEYNKLGVPASHGCIRLTVADAKWIYDNCPPGTPVKIYDSDKKEPLERPTAQKIDLNSPNKGWDPTDPDPKNPWNR